MDAEYILMVEPVEFVGKLDVLCEVKSSIKDNFWVFVLSWVEMGRKLRFYP